MAATIKDVAKKAKVSTATVSLVLHNNNRISPDTKKRVLKAIKELKYHPTRSARGLVSRTSGNIGFILTEDHFSRSEPFYTRIFLGTEFQAREYEYYILLTTIAADYSDQDVLPRFILERNVDGVILAGKVPSSIVDQLVKVKLPIVFVDYYPPAGQFPVVMIDNIDGGFRATQHLIECQRQHIAFIAGDIEHPSISERFQGYKMALEKANIKFNPKLAITNQAYPDRKNGYSATKILFDRGVPVSAIFACNDAMAIGALQYLKENKIRVPEDVSIIGFDDVEANLSLDPPLTTMRVPKEDMGIEAVRLMVDILKHKTKTPRKVLIPVELVVRQSTCILG
ncbi:MAG: LacI family DNA-binding transcriptional regulator [Calditrichia bacterium]